MQIEGVKDLAPVRVDPDQYTAFMQSLQPDLGHTPIVAVQCFEVPDTFRDGLIHAINFKLKDKKAPGSDFLQTEIFRLTTPGLFAEAALELWRAVGRIAHVPTLLRSGLLSPIYKQKGDKSLPTNNRPVCLTTSYRRLISTALTQEVKKYYRHSCRNQWGFQDGTNTECVIAFATNELRRRLPPAAILDLKKGV